MSATCHERSFASFLSDQGINWQHRLASFHHNTQDTFDGQGSSQRPQHATRLDLPVEHAFNRCVRCAAAGSDSVPLRLTFCFHVGTCLSRKSYKTFSVAIPVSRSSQSETSSFPIPRRHGKSRAPSRSLAFVAQVDRRDHPRSLHA